jgi:hypothetical protein
VPKVFVRPRDPEAAALGISTLRKYAAGTPPTTRFDREMAAGLSRLNIPRNVTQRIVTRFDGLPQGVKNFLSPFPDRNAQPSDERRRRPRSTIRPAPTIRVPRPMLERSGLVTNPNQQLPDTGGVTVDPPPPPIHTIRYKGLHSKEDSSTASTPRTRSTSSRARSTSMRRARTSFAPFGIPCQRPRTTTATSIPTRPGSDRSRPVGKARPV